MRGSVKVFGRDTRELSANELAFKVGFVYQNPDHQLFCSTVYEECAYALRNAGLSEEEVRERVKEVLERVGLAGLEDVPPYFLSKGQRLAVAAVLAMRPEVVVVDEPTTGQDYEQSRYVMELLRSLHEEGRTVIVVTHNMRLVAEYAERVVVLRGGVVVADGPTREVMKDVDLLASASLAPPPVTALTLELFGVPALTVAEAVALVGERA
ncbi:MAG: ABC transporter ATP-binding protein [Thermoprotei archaeon]|nr:MAG: ABC transporter ATP-binding protein [Thermoprotei archaeon]